jgi:MoaA/NifB/PqqE/SkfB family radical SAM enzyme
MQNKIVHAAERKAFQTVLDKLIAKGQTEDVSELANSLIELIRKVMGNSWSEESYATLRHIADNPEGKWARYTRRLLRDTDPHILSRFLLNAAYEGGFRGFKTSEELAQKYQCNIPWIVLMDPTSACNMRCTGCWAAEYGHRQNLSFEVMDKVLAEGKELGIHACLFTGGEPLLRKRDILRLCEKHRDVAFHAFTNGTLIDEDFCRDLLRVGNFFVSVSIEGFAKSNDGRRGEGHFNKAIQAMELMHRYKIPFGVSICYTSQNCRDVTSDAFLDMLIDNGCIFAWYFHYMPVGVNADTSLLLTPEQRVYMKDRIREIRGLEGGKELFAIDFQNDGEFAGGCVAAGKRYCHINAAGDVEPCVFIHYSGANINEKSLLECLRQPLFLEYRKGQPFNDNLLLPCPMLENPRLLQKMVQRTGARSTDLEAPESAEHLCGKCRDYARCWQPVADRIWQESHGA